VSPGFVDFVPTPDGRYFVTPLANDGGLEFYDAERVFEGVARGRISDIDPIFTDLRMRDQYPSVGILERGESHTHYRVLTSWFDAVVYRDYDVRVDPRTGLSSVRPMGDPVPPCAGLSLSTPMMSQDGRELAARDEASGTTKIFRILEDGTCEAVVDFGVPTSKVGWHATGRSLAFSIPRRGRRPGAAELGIFVFDRDARRLTHIPGSEAASRLAFPDFIRDEVIYLVPGATASKLFARKVLVCGSIALAAGERSTRSSTTNCIRSVSGRAAVCNVMRVGSLASWRAAVTATGAPAELSNR
jgi:hypothetical protein